MRGIELAGWQLGAALVQELETDNSLGNSRHDVITAEMTGGSPLWLRAEPGFDAEQAEALAAYVISHIGAAV